MISLSRLTGPLARRRALTAAALTASLGCSTGTSSGATTSADTSDSAAQTDSSAPGSDTTVGEAACPRDGVPADFRDVERDAEGVSYSAFGPIPDRTADFKRAKGTFSLLKTVWGRGTAACTQLPEPVVTAIDAAIGRLDLALAAADQKATSYAANDIHLQMAPLFAYFNPSAPPEIVEMDALFLRLGVDAWFGDWSAFDKNVATIEADWAKVKGQAEAKVPTCHRVAGTASLVGDLDATLVSLKAQAQAQDKAGAQVSSEDGLLEVDILELLFDCAPDGTHPDVGVGSACTTPSDCEAGQVCDMSAVTPICAPDPANTHVGGPCVTTVDCGTDSRAACNNEVGDGFPGGYCSMEPCDDVQVCSPGATCVSRPFETPACMQTCLADADCRAAEGYVCQLFPTTPPVGFGPSERACSFPCTDDAGCTSPLTCDVATGHCTP